MEYTLTDEDIDRISGFIFNRVLASKEDPDKNNKYILSSAISDLIKHEAGAKEELDDILDRVKGARIEQRYDELKH